jgi:hypothetical protein
MQNPTEALKSDTGPGNTFDINPKWERTLPSVDNFPWDIYSPPSQKNTFDLNTKGEETLQSIGNLLWGTYNPHPHSKQNPNIKVDI